MFQRLLVLILIAAPGLTFAASKEMQELQRDVAILQEQVKALQQSQDRQLSSITTLVQQAIDAATKANTSAAIIQNGFQQNVKELETRVVAPVVGLGSRMDGMSNDFRTLQQAVSDLTSSLQKLQSQMTDLNNAVKVMQQPAAPPPGAPGGMAQGSGPGSSEAPPISSSDLYANAQRDRTAGKLDLAIQEYSDYLKWYGNTELAPNCQFYIGFIHYSQQDYANAAKDFDMVLEKYSDNNKTPDALFYKGQTLSKMNRRTDAAQEYKELIQRFPGNNLATQACSQLKDMGLRCPAGAAPSRSTAGKKRKE